MSEDLTEATIRHDAIALMESVWLSLDHVNMSSSRRMGLWEELVGRVRSASRAESLSEFVERLGRKLGIMSLSPVLGRYVESATKDRADAVLALCRSEPLVIVAELRARRDEKRIARVAKK